MHRMVSPPGQAEKGCVIGIDHISGLVDLARKNMSSDGIILGTAVGSGKIRGVDVVLGDGRQGK